MKSLRLFILLLFITSEALGSQITVGIFTDEIDVWRYWEKTADGYEPRMIVFNTSDTIVELALWEKVFEGQRLKEDTSKTVVLVEPTQISRNGYMTFDLSTMSDRSAWTEFYVNGKREGILGYQSNPPKDIPEERYISNEGLNGRGNEIWFSKKNLISEENQIDTINLHFNYFNLPMHIHDGHYSLSFFPSMNFDHFVAYLDKDTIGGFNVHNAYSFDVPTFEEIKEEDKVLVQLVYRATKFRHFSIGSSSTLRLYQYKPDKNSGESTTKAVSYVGYEVPILIQ